MRPVRSWEGAAPSYELRQQAASELREGPQENLWRRDVADVLGTARCPLCRMELVAIQGRTGPYFSCRCPAARSAARG